MVDFQASQRAFAAHLRDPDASAAPADIESRRIAIYRRLVYNNIESFLAKGFPVLRTLYSESLWHAMVRDFIRTHACQSPYFLEIAREFLVYLAEERGGVATDPGFLQELAHYEWAELALDIAPDIVSPVAVADSVILDTRLRLSPLAWNLSYRYPVHRLGRHYQPVEAPEQPTFLVVYRTPENQVKFFEVNAVTGFLLGLLDGDGLVGDEALTELAHALQHPEPQSLREFGRQLLIDLTHKSILIHA